MEDSKTKRISEAIETENLLIIQQECVVNRGLLNNNLRLECWPLLLEVSSILENFPKLSEAKKENEYEEIVERDINRSMFSLNIHQDLPEQQREEKRKDLSDIVNAVLAYNKDLHYFQGFHTICTVFYEIGGKEQGFQMSYMCAQTYIRDSMRPTFDQGVIPEMLLIYNLTKIKDKQLAKKIESIHTMGEELTTPMFSLSWVLTWLSHNLNDFDSVCRIFDFILGTHPLAPIYVAVAIIIEHKENIMFFEGMPELHLYFQDVLISIDIEYVCEEAFSLMKLANPSRILKGSKFDFSSEENLVSSPLFKENWIQENRKGFIQENIFWVPAIFVLLVGILYFSYFKS